MKSFGLSDEHISEYFNKPQNSKSILSVMYTLKSQLELPAESGHIVTTVEDLVKILKELGEIE